MGEGGSWSLEFSYIMDRTWSLSGEGGMTFILRSLLADGGIMATSLQEILI